ncbi:MAG: hypothetical protein ACFNX0_04115 [Treponema sp.]
MQTDEQTAFQRLQNTSDEREFVPQVYLIHVITQNYQPRLFYEISQYISTSRSFGWMGQGGHGRNWDYWI